MNKIILDVEPPKRGSKYAKAGIIGLAVLLLVLVQIVFVANVRAFTIRSAVTATATSKFGSLFDIGNTIDQSGLSAGFTSGVDDFDTVVASGITHTFNPTNNEWFTAKSVNAATIDYDLGSIFKVHRFALWNEESAGILLMDVLTSTDNVSFTQVATGIAPTDSVPNVDYGVQVHSLISTSARYIRLNVQGPQLPLGFNGIGMGEIAFDTDDTPEPVPEPATIALLGIGLAGLLGVGARRKWKKKAIEKT